MLRRVWRKETSHILPELMQNVTATLGKKGLVDSYEVNLSYDPTIPLLSMRKTNENI